MKINYVIGNLLDAPEFIIAHGCNAQGVMNSGVAKAIRNKWPAAYEKYMQHYNSRKSLSLGEVIWCSTGGKLIANCVTQLNYGVKEQQYVDYFAIRKCMAEINKFVVKESGLAMPLIGAGLGGGDWSVISKIIEEEIKYATPTVYVLPLEWERVKNTLI